MRIRTALTLGMILLIAACGGSDASTTTSSPTSIPTTTTEAPTTTTTTATTTSTVAETTTTGPQIDVTFAAGEVVGPATISVGVGDPVSVWVLSDVDGEIHVHSYDLRFEAVAGVPIEIAFTADVPGIFEVEVEETSTPMFELEVTP